MSCKEGETCRGGSECQDGICVCAQGLFVRDNKCLPPVSGGFFFEILTRHATNRMKLTLQVLLDGEELLWGRMTTLSSS